LPERSAVDIAIDEAGGDLRRTIELPLGEIDRLTRCLKLVKSTTSYGFSRGWASRQE
jgi:hypothetical protein